MLPSFSIRTRLTLAFGILAAVVLAVAAMALLGLSSANERFLQYTQGLNARATVAAHVRAAVDERAIAARNLVLVSRPADLEVEKTAVTVAHQRVQDQLALLQRMLAADTAVSDKARQLVGEMVKVEQSYGPVALGIVDLALNQHREQAIARMNDECRPLLTALVRATSAYAEYTEARTQALQQQAAHDYALQRSELVAICLFAMVAAIVAGWLITRSITRPLNQAVQAADRIAGGDLAGEITVASSDETGRLMASLQRMQQSLVQTVHTVRGNAESVSVASTQIAQGNSDLSHRTEEQASALQQTSAAMEQLGSTVRHNAENARQGGELAQAAAQIAARGGDVVGQVVSTMHDINESSRQIAEITSLIDGIAFQSNILALNAAVEAARAGDQGRGFAVVAGEVRSLSHRSANAAKEIKALIASSVARVEQGATLVERAGSTMAEIVASVGRVSTIMGEISTATREQSEGVNQIGQAVTQMDQATQQNAALVEESAAAAESLQMQAEELVHAVAVFRIDDAAVPVAQVVPVVPVAGPQAPVRAAAPRVAQVRPAAIPLQGQWAAA